MNFKESFYLSDIIQNIQNDFVYQKHSVINKAFLIAKRNLQGITMKPAMTQE